MKATYFAWVRERIGKNEEEIAPPSNIVTVDDLIGWLSEKGEGYANAFENREIVRAAIDRHHVKHNALIANAMEIAFFPPMTGG